MNYNHRRYPYPYRADPPMYDSNNRCRRFPKDYGPLPYSLNISKAAKTNNNYRTTVWTGKHLQLTLMSIPVGGEIGLEAHYNLDQFLRIEEGSGLLLMGTEECNLDYKENVCDNYAAFIPAGIWHNLVNTGNKPIKLYSIYAPPEHPPGTIHRSKEDSDADEDH